MRFVVLLLSLAISPIFQACSSNDNLDNGAFPAGYTMRKAKFSHYIPSRGGINVGGDPSSTASGELVRDWYYGRGGKGNGVACAPILGFGTRVRLKNFGEFTCIDSGCGIIDTGSALWFDMLVREEDKGRITNNINYGDESPDWEIIEYKPHDSGYAGAWLNACRGYLNLKGLPYIMMTQDELQNSVPFGSGSFAGSSFGVDWYAFANSFPLIGPERLKCDQLYITNLSGDRTVRVRSAPSPKAPVVTSLDDGTNITIAGAIAGSAETKVTDPDLANAGIKGSKGDPGIEYIWLKIASPVNGWISKFYAECR